MNNPSRLAWRLGGLMAALVVAVGAALWWTPPGKASDPITRHKVDALALAVAKASLAKDLEGIMAPLASDVRIEQRHLDGSVEVLYDYQSYRQTLETLLPRMTDIYYRQSRPALAITPDEQQAVYQFTLEEGFVLDEERYDHYYRETWGLEMRRGELKITRVFIEDIY
ncbi:MAG: hypothetical protein ACFCBW_05915 [Candidatus Competibacterales bacterium]